MTESDKKYLEAFKKCVADYPGMKDAHFLLKIINDQEIGINRLERELGAEIKDLYNRIAVQEREIDKLKKALIDLGTACDKYYHADVKIQTAYYNGLKAINLKESNQCQLKTATGTPPLVVNGSNKQDNKQDNIEEIEDLIEKLEKFPTRDDNDNFKEIKDIFSTMAKILKKRIPKKQNAVDFSKCVI